MLQESQVVDPYLGVSVVLNYHLTEKVGAGRIGSVYKCVRLDPADVIACKVIVEGKLKAGWEKEIEKLSLLRGVPNVVPYHAYGPAENHNHRPFTYVLFDFIEGKNLREFLTESDETLDMAFVEDLTQVILRVLYACRAVGIQHGDLHEGNILISVPDKRLPGSPRTIWVSDFGYGGSHNQVEPKDDYRQLFAIIKTLLHRLDPASLNPRDRVMHQKLDDFLVKKLLETDATQKLYVGETELLLRDFLRLAPAAERESAAATKGEELKEPGDYLWAEALGYRADEWRNLFVPEFLAAQDLLSKNISVLTGARGCGKTMAFRRLTAFMDKLIGEPSRVPGADQFIGFYLNCRDLVEAFPWLPTRLDSLIKYRLLHYFHLTWFAEVCKTLALFETDRSADFAWLDQFLAGLFPGSYNLLPQGANVLAHTRAFLEQEKERCRLGQLRDTRGPVQWPLARLDFLDLLQAQLESHVAWIGERPIYLFLDDYTIPIVTREVQRILNPIIFKRRSKLFFKVSTEAANSFEREGLRGKPLELHQDFELIDLATESLHADYKSKEELLDRIFRPRIDRHPSFKGKNLGVKNILGSMALSNNELAWRMRKRTGKNTRSRILYHGAEAFVGTWASDIRIMIQMFADMLREANGALKKGAETIDKAIQDKIYRSTGGEFLSFTESVKNPAFWERGPSSTRPSEPYGKHIREIAEAFIGISRYELTRGKLVSNEGRMNPKQAFRLEIIDKFTLPEKALDYYQGLVRWHIFLQDWRGKSMRGMITPRLYLNRVLIPFSNLTFSSHDNIHLTSEDFALLLSDPKDFMVTWRKRKGGRRGHASSPGEGPTLWDNSPQR